jgi:hypothetical protein
MIILKKWYALFWIFFLIWHVDYNCFPHSIWLDALQCVPETGFLKILSIMKQQICVQCNALSHLENRRKADMTHWLHMSCWSDRLGLGCRARICRGESPPPDKGWCSALKMGSRKCTVPLGLLVITWSRLQPPKWSHSSLPSQDKC